MFGNRGLWLATLIVGLAVALGWSTRSMRAADEPVAIETKATERKAPREARGRLPAFYGEVVSPEQREKIYAIQREFEPLIEDLINQMAELAAERNMAIESVLTPEQLQKVKAMTEESRNRRKSKAKMATDEPAAK